MGKTKRVEDTVTSITERNCRTTKQGWEYRGPQSLTWEGKICQAWTSQLPHGHDRTPDNYPNSGLTENFCRNPDNRTEGPWCYTMDSGTEWQYCTVPSCNLDIDECASNPCLNGGSCNNEMTRYTCNCVSGFNGINCEFDIDECSSSPCQNGGTCINGVNGYTCACLDNFDGTHCQRGCTRLTAIDYLGFDIVGPYTRTYNECVQDCISDSNCVGSIFYRF